MCHEKYLIGPESPFPHCKDYLTEFVSDKDVNVYVSYPDLLKDILSGAQQTTPD